MYEKHVLNNALKNVAYLLKSITNWFIVNGALLGIVRNNSCLDGDYDIDIVCSDEDYNKIIEIGRKNNFKIKSSLNSISWKKENFPSIDFCCSKIEGDNFNYKRTIWKNCFPLITRKGNGKLARQPVARNVTFSITVDPTGSDDVASGENIVGAV